MGELLEELRAELINKHDQLRDAEGRLVVLEDDASKAMDAARVAIEKVSEQKSEIKMIREEVNRLEDDISPIFLISALSPQSTQRLCLSEFLRCST